MITGTLNRVREQVIRSIYEQIRRVLVDNGYLPDITNYTTVQAYDTAIDNIKQTKGYFIGLYSHGSVWAKEKVLVPRIVIRRRRTLPGSQGITYGFSGYTKNPNNTTWKRTDRGVRTEDMQVDIYLVSGTAEQDETLHSVISLALAQTRYIPFVDTQEGSNEPSDYFLIDMITQRDRDENIEGQLVFTYTYMVYDLHTIGIREFDETLVPLTELDIDIKTPLEEPNLDNIHIEAD